MSNAVGPSPQQARYVLVVEDDRDDFFLTEDLLRNVEGQPYRVAWSGSYESARQQLREQHFDVCLVDYRIAERTGLEFISQVGPLYPNCPMILLTGLRSPDIDLAAQAAGAADYLVKDSLTEELLDRSIRYACQHAERWSLLNSVLNNAASGMVALDASGTPIVWNRQALRALDLPEQIIGNGAETVWEAMKCLMKGGILPHEFVNRASQAFEVNVSEVPGGGRVIAFHDVTRRAQAEQLLRRAVADAEAANRSKSSFLATISHELRTPLNGILGMVRVLERTEIDEAQQSFIDTIKSSGETLLGIINDVLDLSKIEAGRMELEDIEFELVPLVEEVVKLLTPNAFAKGIEVAGYVDPRIARVVTGDPLRIKQTLTNLVGNAIKFTASGSVTVFVTETVADDERQLHFSVCDTGIGIPEEKLGQLFQKFTQVDASTTRKYGGTGLGLALCKEIVTLMGGSIGCDSVEGEGSTFHFSIPGGETNAAAELILKRESGCLAGKRLLLISPEPALAAVLTEFASALGGNVVHADSEAAAMAAWLKAPGGHVIFDRFADDTPPDELLRHIRRQRTSQDTRVWLLLPRDDAQRGHSDLFDDHLPRPLVGSALDRLRASLQSAGGARKPKGAMQRPGVTQRNLRILIAEDNIPNQRVAAAMLRSAGFEPEIVCDGQQAVDRIAAEPFDVVLMDVNMPVLDGLEATRLIRDLENGRDIPIIGLTANAMRDDRTQCIEVGMTEHMAKPVDWDKLIGMLNALDSTPSSATLVA